MVKKTSHGRCWIYEFEEGKIWDEKCPKDLTMRYWMGCLSSKTMLIKMTFTLEYVYATSIVLGKRGKYPWQGKCLWLENGGYLWEIEKHTCFGENKLVLAKYTYKFGYVSNSYQIWMNPYLKNFKFQILSSIHHH